MMKKYDYMEAMKNDIKEYLENDFSEDVNEFERDDLAEKLNDDLWIDDSVTGNASGSYTFGRETAKEYVLDNMDLLDETIQEFCIEASEVGKRFISEDWEYFDVSIRCYLLGKAIDAVLTDMGI